MSIQYMSITYDLPYFLNTQLTPKNQNGCHCFKMAVLINTIPQIVVLLIRCVCGIMTVLIKTCYSLALSTGQGAVESMFFARTCVRITPSTTVTFDDFQQRCRCCILLHPVGLQYWTMSFAVKKPAPLHGIHAVPKPGLHLEINTPAVVSSSICCRWEALRRQIAWTGNHLSTELRCSLKIQDWARYTAI